MLNARPDLAEPLRAALRAELGDDAAGPARRAGRETTRPRSARSSWSIVGGYYTDRDVRDRIGYPGQVALTLQSWEYPAYLEEGLIDAVLARGPVWRDPATGQRAVVAERTRRPTRSASPTAEAAEGGRDGHDGA